MQEPHKAAYEYLFELVAGLKHMIVTRVSYDSSFMTLLLLWLVLICLFWENELFFFFFSIQETENRAPVSALRSRTRKREGKGNS